MYSLESNMKTQQLVETLGWSIEDNYSHALDRPIYRAYQGGFKTLWRNTPEQVLADIRKLKEARETCKAPF